MSTRGEGPAGEPPSGEPRVARRLTRRWLLRQLAFWLLVVLIPIAIWLILTWQVGLPSRRTT